MHCITKQYNIREKKWNAMQCDEKKTINQGEWGLLVFYEGMMNEWFVVISTVTGSRIRGCFSKPRCSLSVTSGWQQMMNAIDGLSNLRKKIMARFVAPIWKKRKLIILQRHPVWHRNCHWINNANSYSLWIVSIASVWYFLKPWCRTTAQYSRTGLMTEEYQMASRSEDMS